MAASRAIQPADEPGNQRGRNTRARILDAGDICFSEHGLSLTIDQVAEAAGITRMTVHRHVGGREQLVTHLVLRASNRLADVLRQVFDGPGPLLERLADALVLTVVTIRATPALERLFTRGEVTGPWSALDPDARVLSTVHEFYRPFLDEAAAAGLLRHDVDAAEAVSWLLAQALLTLTVPGIARSEADVRRFFVHLALPAVLAAPGRPAQANSAQ